MVDEARVHPLNAIKSPADGFVVYWISRDQRVHDNWALLFAQQQASILNTQVLVVFTLANKFLDATWRQYHFMLEGLYELEQELARYNIPFILLMGDPVYEMKSFLNNNPVSMLITDFDPLRIKQQWKSHFSKELAIPFYEIDAHNIVPCRYVSDKQEFAAYTLRPKIKKQLDRFLTDYPKVEKQKSFTTGHNNPSSELIKENLEIDFSVKPVNWIKPGEKEAINSLHDFLINRLQGYSTNRNNPNYNAQSNLSPYIHFGQLSAQRIAIETVKINSQKEDEEAFLEELIIRRELSDNYCFYNQHYDNLKGAPGWALNGIDAHKKDEREYTYTKKEFENAQTHDALWNAAQTEMVNQGKMHGYMRMYWAKKILEWTPDVETALDIAIYLNDKYELDGRDPNGYVGCQWSITGLHDRPWAERPVFGKIRYMNYNGCKRKFNVEQYIQQQTEPKLM
jgi:deoxyribodipyrimidine photo-lyase